MDDRRKQLTKVTALATVLAAAGAFLLGRALNKRRAERREPPCISASVTIERAAADIYYWWLKRSNAANAMERPSWAGKVAEGRDATLVVWKAPKNPRRLTIELRSAPGDRGTETTLKVPGGASHTKLKQWARRAKWLLEAGQLPAGSPR